jgi:histidine triad (HIT) family protein
MSDWGGADPSCPFCAIVRGDDTAVARVCESESWLAFFPPEPATPGHTLIVPKVHVFDLWHATPELAGALMTAAHRVGRAVRAALMPEGLNLISSAGEVAEQTVFHLHLHVVPRWRDDGFGHIWPPKRPLENVDIADLQERVGRMCASMA